MHATTENKEKQHWVWKMAQNEINFNETAAVAFPEPKD